MAVRFSTRSAAIAGAVLVMALAVGWWALSAHQKRSFDRSAVALVTDAATRLDRALGMTATGEAGALEAHAEAADAGLQALRRLDSRSNLALADAADEYLVTAREILRRLADRRRHRQALAASGGALRAHMRSDNRTGAWVQQAVSAKERVNRDYRGHQLATEALDGLLRDFAATQRKIAPWLDAQRLVPEIRLQEVRSRLQQESAAVTAEFGQLERLRGAR